MFTFHLLANNFSLETTLSLGSPSLNVLEQAFLLVQERLRGFASEPDCSQKLALAFGNGFDAQKAQDLAQAWQDGDFSAIPTIEVLSAEQLNGANGAFAVSTNRIYLSEAYLSAIASDNEAISLQSLVNLLLEEIGHFVDAQINSTDSAGDEGAIFAKIVQMHGGGEALSPQELQQLKAEDDGGIIILNGAFIAVEQQDFIGGDENNTFTGTEQPDLMQGNGGNDVLYGRGGNDTLDGGEGDDYLDPGTGVDSVDGGAGSDGMYLARPLSRNQSPNHYLHRYQ